MFLGFLALAFPEIGTGGRLYEAPVDNSTIVDFCLLAFYCYTHSHFIYFAVKAAHLR
jgi:hypothetical protein